MVVGLRVQLLENGNPIIAAPNGFPINGRGLYAEQVQRVLDPREATSPLEATARKDPRSLAVPTDDQTVAVMLDFVDPLAAMRGCGAH
jgi:hypothetical protein